MTPASLRALRPLQWTKNGLLFAALVFDEKLLQPDAVLIATLAFVVFCGLSSAIYLINDLRDVAEDRAHPIKRLRPIATGALSRRRATIIAASLAAAAFLLSWLVGELFLAVAALYFGLMVLYTFGLKRIVLVDVLTIAAGFVIRAAAGAIAINVDISPWLLVCTFLLALLLGFGKRRHERLVLRSRARLHRRTLAGYTTQLLDQLIATSAAATLIAYGVYTFDSAAVPANHLMMLTIPIVVYAVFRYLYLMYARNLGGSPEVLLVRDRPLLASLVLWGATSVAILYGAA